MLRKVKARYNDLSDKENKIYNWRTQKEVKAKCINMPRSRCIGKKRRHKMLLGENYNCGNMRDNLKIVTSIKYDCMGKKRERKIKEEGIIASASTSFTIVDKDKRKEFQGNKTYKRQKGGKANIDVFKKPLKSQKTGRWKYFNLYNETDLKFFTNISHQMIDNEIDDDWDTDEETAENGVAFNNKKLIYSLNDFLSSKLDSSLSSD